MQNAKDIVMKNARMAQLRANPAVVKGVLISMNRIPTPRECLLAVDLFYTMGGFGLPDCVGPVGCACYIK